MNAMNASFAPLSLIRSLACSAPVAATLLAAASPANAADLAIAPDPQEIVGGDRNSGDPSVPMLVVYGEAGESSICTGSLISSQWILTAAHCVDPASVGFEPFAIEVYFGTEYIEADPGFLYSGWADNYLQHEQFNINDLEAGFDIAVVHLEQAVPLPPMPLIARELSAQDVGAPIRLIGWGITDGGLQDSGVKRQVASSLYDFDDLLALVGAPGANICNGDSGGPAVLVRDGQEVIFGVTSFGDLSCGEVGVDTRVDVFLDWIAAVTDGEVGPNGSPPNGSPPSGDPSGATCAAQTDCPSGAACIEIDGQGECVATCNSDADCPQGQLCFATDDPSTNICWIDQSDDDLPSPGLPQPPGTSPHDDDDDDSDGDDSDGDDSDDDDSDGGGENSGSGGCSVDPSPWSPAGLLGLIAVLFGAGRRRRRIGTENR